MSSVGVGLPYPSAPVVKFSIRSKLLAGYGTVLALTALTSAVGLRDLKRAGGMTIAQDEASSVIFGMPGAAIGLGIVDHILPPDQIASLLIQLGQTSRR